MTDRKTIKIKVITLSDRASRGEYADESGPQIKKLAGAYFEGKRITEFEQSLLPDDAVLLKAHVLSAVGAGFDLIFTTGGTGIGPRDLTPDTVKPLLDKEIPGIMELIRVKYGMQKPAALLSRGVAGVIGKTLIYCLPGSVKAVTEYCGEIFPTIEHSLNMVYGIDSH